MVAAAAAAVCDCVVAAVVHCRRFRGRRGREELANVRDLVAVVVLSPRVVMLVVQLHKLRRLLLLLLLRKVVSAQEIFLQLLLLSVMVVMLSLAQIHRLGGSSSSSSVVVSHRSGQPLLEGRRVTPGHKGNAAAAVAAVLRLLLRFPSSLSRTGPTFASLTGLSGSRGLCRWAHLVSSDSLQLL